MWINSINFSIQRHNNLTSMIQRKYTISTIWIFYRQDENILLLICRDTDSFDRSITNRSSIYYFLAISFYSMFFSTNLSSIVQRKRSRDNCYQFVLVFLCTFIIPCMQYCCTAIVKCETCAKLNYCIVLFTKRNIIDSFISFVLFLFHSLEKIY